MFSAGPAPLFSRRFTRLVVSVVWPFVAAIVVLALFAIASIDVLMGLRSYGYGENLWTKNQKRATFHLLRYAQTGDAEPLREFEQAMIVFWHYRMGRIALTSETPDTTRALYQFIQTGAPERDIRRVVAMHQRFAGLRPAQELIDLWAQADLVVLQLEPLSDEITDAHRMNRPAELAQLSARIEELDRQMAPLTDAFSASLSDTAYLVYRVLIWTGISLGLLIATAVLVRTVRLLRARHHAESALAQERRRAAVTLASIDDAVLTTDAQGQVTYMNPAARRLAALQADTDREVGSNGTDRLDRPVTLSSLFTIIEASNEESGETMARGGGAVARIAEAGARNGATAARSALTPEILGGRASGRSGASDQRLIRRDGTEVPIAWVASPVRDERRIQGAVLILRDTTREQQLIDRLSWMATHDPLTTLPNRREFDAQLQRALDGLRTGELAENARSAGTPGHHVLMLIDLDQFKLVNDTSGHAAGDELLRIVGAAMQTHLRKQDTLARMGGDEFGLLLTNCAPEIGSRKAEELRRTIERIVYSWGSKRYAITASIGLVNIQGAHESPGVWLSAADIACYAAKEAGRNRVVVYQRDDAQMVMRQGEMAWVQHLQDALERDAFLLYAQPVQALQPGVVAIRRVELLLRLRDASGQIVPPGTFMPAAERFGLVPQIDRWVVDRALEIIARRALQDPDGAGRCVYGINLSGSAFGDVGFLAEIKSLFARHGVRPQSVCFEITETQAVANLTRAREFISELRAMGCSFALDDFGAGMSSFAYLKYFQVDLLKIDGNLVKDILAEPLDRAMVEMIASLGRTMKIRTVGEFAETDAIIAALRESGVDYAQGYAIAIPEPFD